MVSDILFDARIRSEDISRELVKQSVKFIPDADYCRVLSNNLDEAIDRVDAVWHMGGLDQVA
jgi:hypothetical protein